MAAECPVHPNVFWSYSRSGQTDQADAEDPQHRRSDAQNRQPATVQVPDADLQSLCSLSAHADAASPHRYCVSAENSCKYRPETAADRQAFADLCGSLRDRTA